jgi:hypothetical protein
MTDIARCSSRATGSIGSVGNATTRPKSVSYNILLKADAGWIFDLISVVISSCTIGLLITINVVMHFANFLIWSIPIRPAPDQEDHCEN